SKMPTLNPKELYDSIRTQLRHRNYSSVKNLCYDLIDEHPTSSEAIASLQTLYIASVKTDTSSSAVTTLKSYYETLILNHGSNSALVKISNYLVQKCKVLLRQYSSALAGFQQIISENQYNYEGLLARWDYMATSLLMQGQGGSERDVVSVPRTDIEDDLTDGDDDRDKYGNRTPFTKEQRKVIRETITNVNERNRNYNEARINNLEALTKSGDKEAEEELTKMRILKDVIKSERPKDIIQHIQFVNSDIQKIFGSPVNNSLNSVNNIPTVFSLSQNYPNPFNPVTKIKFGLPRDSKVNLVIYDILGREVKRLVNNEFKSSGLYIVEFNGSNYASGVYFLRIEAEELDGKKFIDSKKMVLVK
ncbi:MAG: T9SS type A sorting domain-containing protein, partial [Chlorobi bacterium]|nr:T9SS type A sorting domain-containing protein [Chlorobiota bacterium]